MPSRISFLRALKRILSSTVHALREGGRGRGGRGEGEGDLDVSYLEDVVLGEACCDARKGKEKGKGGGKRGCPTSAIFRSLAGPGRW